MEEIEDVVCDCEIQKEIVKVEGKTRLTHAWFLTVSQSLEAALLHDLVVHAIMP